MTTPQHREINDPKRCYASWACAGLKHRSQRKNEEVSRADPVLRGVDDISQCDFYHFVDLPDGRTLLGQWDLRGHADTYLGNIQLAGRTVLEVGPASGFLTFEMEKRGAAVTCIEPPLSSLWDFVPRPGLKIEETKRQFASHINRIRNGYWYLHKTFRSEARLFEADAYDLPEELGTFDIGTLAAVLLHCRSPVTMIDSVGRRVSETMIICDQFFPDLSGQPVCRLVPGPHDTVINGWWQFSSEFFTNYLAVIGFTKANVSFHQQLYADAGKTLDMFTVVASR